jgi:simple sugar transport system permease protein
MDDVLGLGPLLASTIRFATPLGFAALGGLFSERSGVVNIGLEGMMLISAFAGVVGSYASGSALVGLATGLAAGLLIGLVHAAVSVSLQADQIISGTAINLLALGGTGFLMETVFGSGGTSPRVAAFDPVRIPGLADIPIIGEALFNQSVLVYLLYLLVPLTVFVLRRTRFGLRLRATGEVPEAVDTAGISVVRMRYAGVALSGMLAALGGVYLSMSLLSAFTENMTLGRGFIALAALIFGRWTPVGAIGAALLFGLAQALVVTRGSDVPIPQEFVAMFPYVLTIIALATFGGRAVAPAASGKPYRKE